MKQFFCSRWRSVRLASLFHENTVKNEDFLLSNALQFRYGSIVQKKKFDLTSDLIETYKKYTLIQPGDIMINGLNLNYDFITQRVALVPSTGIITSAYICLRPQNSVNYRFYTYYLKALDALKVFNGLGTGIRLTLSYDSIKNMVLPLPPREEQDQIVRYLDWQVSKINRLIAAKRKEIALLKEQKQRKTTEVVVHGLKPNVPHKDTGIAWIGSIPAHWHCVALKRCATVKSGITLGKQYPVGTNLVSVPYLRVANVQDGFVNIETVTNLNVTPEEAAQYRLPRGCVLMTEGGDRDKLGRGCVWNGEIENCIHQNHIFAVTVNDKLLLNKWLEYVSACDIGRVYFDVTAIKTTNLACTNASKVMAFPIPLPPRDEQECIINELNRITSRFNNAREGLEKQIEYLQELRIRLISDVVTGQIDVRGIEVPKHESVDDVVAESEVEELEVE